MCDLAKRRCFTLLSAFIRERQSFMPLIILPDLQLYGEQVFTQLLLGLFMTLPLKHVTNIGRRV